MRVIDKGDILGGLGSREHVALELGCGDRKRDSRTIGIDAIDYNSVDVVGDAIEVLRMMPDECIDEISSYHFLEHVSDLDTLMEEIARVLKDGGVLASTVPHFSNPFFYSDPTHHRYFGLYTFLYFADGKLFSRKVPAYCKKNGLVVTNIELVFKSYRPHYFRHAWKRLFGAIVNSFNPVKEFYEENMCWLVPCYEIRCKICKTSRY